MMEEIASLFEEADRLYNSKRRKNQEEALQAEEMRNTSLETFKESQKRDQEGKPKPKKRKRASGADSLAFLEERVETESQQKKEELELRKQELQMEKEAKEADWNLRAKEHDERVEQTAATTVTKYEYGFNATATAANPVSYVLAPKVSGEIELFSLVL